MHNKTWFKYSASGAAAGIINGLFGAGGGMVLVPLLIKYGRLEDKQAFATAISIIFPLCLVSIMVYGSAGAIELTTTWPYLVGGLIGGLLGGLLFKRVSANILHKIFGILILWGGIRLLR